MSKISDVYDTLRSFIMTKLPSHYELNNPRDISISPEISLDGAFGIEYGPGSNLDSNQDSGVATRDRIFEVTLTRRVFGTARNSTTRIDAEKALMEDLATLTNAIEEDSKLGKPEEIVRATYLTDEGVAGLRIDRQDILLVGLNISIEYHEEVPLCV